MPSIKAIKQRISGVSSTQQIVQAMDMVSASKLQRIKPQLEDARRIYEELSRIVADAAMSIKVADNPFVSRPEVANTAFVVLTGDRGLCGSYNTNVTKLALSCIQGVERASVIAVGLYGLDYLKNRQIDILQGYTGMSGTASYEDAKTVAQLLISQYIEGKIDEAYVVYTRYVSALEHMPVAEKLLPLSVDQEDVLWYETTRFEPDINIFLDYATRFYTCAYLYNALTESAVCEHTARMTSMQAASSNAEEILEDLTQEYNRSRQNAVTQDINEIIGGARALRKQREQSQEQAKEDAYGSRTAQSLSVKVLE